MPPDRVANGTRSIQSRWHTLIHKFLHYLKPLLFPINLTFYRIFLFYFYDFSISLDKASIKRINFIGSNGFHDIVALVTNKSSIFHFLLSLELCYSHGVVLILFAVTCIIR